ncbi:phosphotransferase [Litorisediminicola beolgyonensis]|uniref:Phosphotransferase n=1 Tax=Litorisediminicola beolgyonensis TaxID=1173614 RepID=A0ABW3ZHV8_9RHOB
MEDLDRDARALWPDLAREAGLDPSGWTASRLALRQDARVARVLLRMSRDGADLVLKYEARPERPEAFLAQMARHSEIAARFPSGAHMTVPPLLAIHPERQACLMGFVAGTHLSRLTEEAPASDHPALLRRAGAWIAAFHQSGFGERRPFRPKFQLDYLDRILAEMDAGTRRVAQDSRFRAAAARYRALAPGFAGRQSVTAALHGDLHMRNIVIGPQTAGLDFAEAGSAPVGHDLARLLVDYATLRADPKTIAPGDVLPAAARDGFFAGYDLVGPDDPSVGLLLRHRILADWWGLPATEAERSPAQDRRLRRLMALAERSFADPT